MKFRRDHLQLVIFLVLLYPFKLRAVDTRVVTRQLNANFLSTQCWEPTKQSPVLSLLVEAENKTTDLQQTNFPQAIASNDLRAYYYYLSDPDLKIEIKQECQAIEISDDRRLKIIRRKYVFVDSKGGQVEVVSEENEPSQAITRENLAAEDQPKVSKKGKHLLMSLISGGADYTIKQKEDDQ